jgi:hypothetical protein
MPSYNRSSADPSFDRVVRLPKSQQEGKTMVQAMSLFTQLRQHFPSLGFAALVKKHRAERAAKGFQLQNAAGGDAVLPTGSRGFSARDLQRALVTLVALVKATPSGLPIRCRLTTCPAEQQSRNQTRKRRSAFPYDVGCLKEHPGKETP